MKKILIVDDQPDNVFILQDRLKNYGFATLTAYNGMTAIEKAKTEQPDLILLDVMMPEMSGFDVCKILVNDNLTKSIPIILVTALNDAEDIKEGLQAGAYDYIKKPFNKIELLARINSALRFSETNKMLIEVEAARTYAATIVTANHEIKQPLTLINLSTTAIKREMQKEEPDKDKIVRRLASIENANQDIITILDKLSAIKKPILTDYVNDMKMVALDKKEKS